MPGPQLQTLTAPDGTAFRDLDHDGVMAPFEDPRRTPDERADDLLGRLSLAEKAGLLFHDIIEVGPQGTPDGGRRHGRPLLDPSRGDHGADQPRQRARAALGPGVGAVVERAAGAGGDHPALDPGHGEHATRGTASPRTPAPPSPPARCRSGRSRSAWRRCATRSGSASSPTSRARSTWPSASAQPAPADRPGHRAALGTAVPHLRQRRGLRRRRRGGLHRGLPAAPRARPGLGGHHGQALPRRRAAARRRGRALPVRAGAGLPGRPVRRAPDPVPPGDRGRHLRADALLRHADRPGAGRRAGRGGRVRLQPADPHRAAAAAARLRRRRSAPTGDWSPGPSWPAGRCPARAWGVEHLSRLDRVVKIIDAGADQFGGEACPELVLRSRGHRAAQRAAARRVGSAAAAA